MGSTIETLQDTVSRINEDQINNGGGNTNRGGNKMVKKMHRMAVVVEIIDLTAETLESVLEDMDRSII